MIRRIAWALAVLSVAVNAGLLVWSLPPDGVPAGYRQWRPMAQSAFSWAQAQIARAKAALPQR